MSDWSDPSSADGFDGTGDDGFLSEHGDGDDGRVDHGDPVPPGGWEDDALPDERDPDGGGSAAVDGEELSGDDVVDLHVVTEEVASVAVIADGEPVQRWQDAGPGELFDPDLGWWVSGVSVAAELIEVWPMAPGFDGAVLTHPWTSGFGLDPVPDFADPALLGSPEPPPAGPVDSYGSGDDPGGDVT